MPNMLIDKIKPDVVGARSTLPECLMAEAASRGLPPAAANLLLSVLPPSLAQAGAFYDVLKNIWRYEFGSQFHVNTGDWWGTHMWLPVEHLFDALACALTVLSNDTQASYLALLDHPDKHGKALVEMIPVAKLTPGTLVQYEVAGLGDGRRSIDWVIGPYQGRTVLCDVKKRDADILHYFGQLDETEEPSPEPGHDHTKMFRSVEHKFRTNDPDKYLQGVWIVAEIRQNERHFADAFLALDADKVHFAVLGDWQSDAHILTRREQDKRYLQELFRVTESTRWVFTSA
jgi:hypothetical protein